MRIANTLALTICLISLTGCSTSTAVCKHPAPPSSEIEGFGVADTAGEAAKLAWDDAIERAKQLGYEKFAVELVSRSSGRTTYKGNTNASTAVVKIEVHLVDAPTKKPLPVALYGAGDDVSGDSR
ncbi:MAG: hypothetical protein KTR15_12545 [Phycisphaeraceae bacterium]|nr:hypothetical protein [Phycisphaeraceae bacterium]